MPNWNLLFRRTHLYLGLLLIPWMLIYALSTFVFNHGEHFRPSRAAEPLWLPLWEKDYAFDAPADTAALRTACDLPPTAKVVTILCDRAERYYSTKLFAEPPAP